MAHDAAKGCATTAGLLALVVLAVPLGWMVYDIARPHDPLELLFQQTIRDAAMSDQFNEKTGWDEIDVTSQICGKVSPEALAKLGMSSEYRASSLLPTQRHLSPADIWMVVQNKNFFAMCADHSVRKLSMEFQRSNGMCRAFVSAWPTCDP